MAAMRSPISLMHWRPGRAEDLLQALLDRTQASSRTRGCIFSRVGLTKGCARVPKRLMYMASGPGAVTDLVHGLPRVGVPGLPLKLMPARCLT